MFTAPIVHLLVLLFCNWCQCTKPELKPVDVHSANFTKRPLNLYVTENGKHAVVQQKIVDLNSCNEKNECKTEKLVYTESLPPFLIKTRGCALLIYDLNSDQSPKWHTHGRPSIVQMLAASGHRTITIGLEHLWKQSSNVDQLINNLNLTNIVLILPELSYTDFDLLKSLATLTQLNAAVLISPNRVPPIVTKTIVVNGKQSSEFLDSPGAQEIVVEKPLKEGNQEKVMKVIANFLDFIHPR